MTELTPEQHDSIQAARKALVRAIEREYPPRAARSLVAVAIAGQFASMCAGSAGIPELIETINESLSEAGLKLVKLAPN